MEKISIPGYISWTRIADAVYIIDERDESIITLEDSGIRLWELIVNGNFRDHIVGIMSRVGYEREDREEIVAALDFLVSLGIIAEESYGR